MKIPFISLAGPTRQIKKQYLKEVEKLLDGGSFILGEAVERFEKQWAKAVGTKYAVGVSSGTDALWLALTVLGIGSGDEVITQGNAYNASVTAILRVGAKPRFADILSDTMTVDPVKIEPLINKKTKAILPVHLYGQPNDMDKIMQLAKRYKLSVVEDCAQSHLAKWRGKITGSFGDAGAFSFYPTKNLGAFGDAGAVVTNRKEIYEKILALRNLGQAGKNNHVYLGYNMRLDPIQAVALGLKIKFLKGSIRQRRTAAKRYDRLIEAARIPIRPIAQDLRSFSVYHLYPVLSFEKPRDKIRRYLLENGIQTEVHYPLPVYRQPFYRYRYDPCPVAEKCLSAVLSLPFYADISLAFQRRVVDVIRRYFKK